jgi:hypothetical protein
MHPKFARNTISSDAFVCHHAQMFRQRLRSYLTLNKYTKEDEPEIIALPGPFMDSYCLFFGVPDTKVLCSLLAFFDSSHLDRQSVTRFSV